jgi:hypothetical protein
MTKTIQSVERFRVGLNDQSSFFPNPVINRRKSKQILQTKLHPAAGCNGIHRVAKTGRF